MLMEVGWGMFAVCLGAYWILRSRSLARKTDLDMSPAMMIVPGLLMVCLGLFVLGSAFWS